jgi:putative hydrolase of the HAD superfamily
MRAQHFSHVTNWVFDLDNTLYPPQARLFDQIEIRMTTPYLTHVHDVSLENLTPDPALRAGIAALPGRRFVYTNGCAPYAERVLDARGLSGLFDGIFGVEHADFHPKPDRIAFETVFSRAGLDTARAAMFEDDPRNLSVPHQMGMRTVHVAPEPAPAPYIEHHTDDLADFLAQLCA